MWKKWWMGAGKRKIGMREKIGIGHELHCQIVSEWFLNAVLLH